MDIAGALLLLTRKRRKFRVSTWHGKGFSLDNISIYRNGFFNSRNCIFCHCNFNNSWSVRNVFFCLDMVTWVIRGSINLRKSNSQSLNFYNSRLWRKYLFSELRINRANTVFIYFHSFYIHYFFYSWNSQNVSILNKMAITVYIGQLPTLTVSHLFILWLLYSVSMGQRYIVQTVINSLGYCT